MYMTRWVAAAACLLALALEVPVRAASPHAQIRSQMETMDAAAKSHDADGFLKYYEHGPQLVYVINGRIIHGWDALHAQQLKWWHNGNSDVHYAYTAPIGFTDVSPSVAVTTEQLSSRRTGPDGKLQSGNFVVTSIWKRQHGEWQVVYAHESWAH